MSKADEMKTRISMALKDPILQQGFEIICKEIEQIEHLREERNYFQEKCEDIELNYYCDRIGGCKVQELEKENAELRYKLEEIKKRILPQDMCELMAEVKENYDNKVKAEQLTKAKALIKNLMYTPRECIPWYDLFNKTKQFLKEIEK